jgi:E-phenylitaconyl-CoA hydratase
VSIEFEIQDRIGLITINRPEAMNALNSGMNQRLVEVWQEVRDNSDIWVAVITGAGSQAFCAGADLKEARIRYENLTSLERRFMSERDPAVGGISRNLWVSKPIVAAVNGHCLGGGLELALACDIRVASNNASFGMTEISWGLSPNAGGTQRLPRLVPFGVALEMLLTAEPISAQRAYEVGLVNRVVRQEDLMETSLAIAKRVCANAPLAAQVVKEAAWRGRDLPLEAGLRLESHLGEPLRNTHDAMEGIEAFREKRKPDFLGE